MSSPLPPFRHLESLLRPLDDNAAVNEWLEKIVEAVTKKNLDSAVIEKEFLIKVVQVNWNVLCFCDDKVLQYCCRGLTIEL